MKINELKLGAALSYTNILLSNVINLLFTPFLLTTLGNSEYGLYMLIGAFVGYMAVLDFGLGNTIIRYVAKYRAENDKQGEQGFLSLAFLIYGILSIISIIIGLALIPLLPMVFGKLTVDELITATKMFEVLIINIGLTLFLNAFTSIMSGYEKFVFPRAITIIRVIARPLAIVALLLLGYKAFAIVVVDTILNVLLLIVNMWFVFCKMKIKVRYQRQHWSFVKEILLFSVFVFINMIVDQIYWRLGQTVVGIFYGAAPVAIFAIGMQFPVYYMNFSTAISGVFLPRATQMCVDKAPSNELTDLFIKTGRIQFIVIGFILSGFILLGKPFLFLFVGNKLGNGYVDAYIIALIAMVPLTIPLVQNVGISILQAKNLHAFRSIMYLVISILNFGISILLTKQIGIIGAVIGTSISLILGNIIIINIYYQRKVGLNIPRFFKEVFNRLLPAIILSIAVGYSFLYIPVGGWTGLLIKGILFSIVYVISVWKIGTNAYEKHLFAEPVKMIIKRVKG
jgi:O-antigen/teichoic acid export membrane protein